MLCWGLVEQVVDKYKKQYIIDVLLWVPKERDTTVVPSELNKMGEVKRTNEPPKYISYDETTEVLWHPIGKNSLLIYPNFGIGPFHPRLQEYFAPLRPSGVVDNLSVS